MFNELSGESRTLIAVLGLLLVAALAEGQAGLFVLLAIMAGLYAYRQHQERDDYYEDEDQYEVPQRYREREDLRRERPTNAEQVHRHAIAAVRRAGIDPAQIPVLAVDIGTLVFKDNNPPVLHRTIEVEDDADYIQPFVQLRVPSPAVGKVQFEIIDPSGDPVFIHEDRYELKRGRNLIIPSTRLPIHDELNMAGRWELRITADNMLIASHVFGWAHSEAAGFERHLGEDGEINTELRAVLADSQINEMSLDELLSFQDDDAAQQTR